MITQRIRFFVQTNGIEYEILYAATTGKTYIFKSPQEQELFVCDFQTDNIHSAILVLRAYLSAIQGTIAGEKGGNP